MAPKTALPRLVIWLPLMVVLAVWQLMGSRSESIAFFFATPAKVFAAALSMLGEDLSLLTGIIRNGEFPPAANGGLLWNAGITAAEAFSGFVIGNALGMIIGIALWYTATIARIARPYLVALGALPVFAIAPMTILWFGIGISAKIALAVLSTVFLAAAQAFKGAEQVDPLLLRRFKVFGASRAIIFRRLLLPSALVWIVASLRLTIGAALLGAFVGEFIASEQGIGHIIIRAGGLYDMPRVLVGVFAMIAMAMLLEGLVGRFEKYLFKWRGEGG
jgi:NitT/TauT family transport system permease protein